MFLQYAALEEAHGLARAAMEVYDQAVRTVPPGQRLPIYNTYLARASDFFGIAKAAPPHPVPTSFDVYTCKGCCLRGRARVWDGMHPTCLFPRTA